MNKQLSHRSLEVVASPAPKPVRRQAARILPRQTGWFLLVGLAALLAFGRARFSLSLVQGDSMLPGLRSGDLLIVDHWAYRAADLERGDLVVAKSGSELLVKRVVGLPGEELELRLGELYVNRLAYAEYYPVEPGRLSLRSGRLFEDRYALLGDNRDVNVPTSVHAIVSKHQIVGKVVHSLRLWPGGRSSHGISTV